MFEENRELPFFLEEHLIFLRKSRSDNPSETVEETLARHERILQELAVKLTGKKIPEKNIYREVVSGGEELEQRPEFLKALKRLEKGNIKGVLVVDPQRLSRSGMYGAGDIINAFLYTDTLICTPTKTYDLNDKFDKKFIEMELLQGADYLEYSKQILARGRMAALKEGKFIGSEPPYGYDKKKLVNDKGYKLGKNKEEAKIVKMIYEMYIDDCIGTITIANELNRLNIKPRHCEYWQPDYIRTILTNPTYYGMLVWQKRKKLKVLEDGKVKNRLKVNKDPLLFKGLHDPIIQKEKFDLVQERLRSHHSNKTPRTAELKNPLAGLIKCGKCDTAIVMKKPTGSKNLIERRTHHLDKEMLNAYLRRKKDESGLSLTEIANLLNMEKSQVEGWFAKSLNRVHYSKTFANRWFQLKELLNITSKRYDRAITSFELSRLGNIIECRNARCNNVSSYHALVEQDILNDIKAKLSRYKTFIDDYEEVIIKDKTTNEEVLKRVQNDIEKLNKRLKNARIFYELEDYTREEYLEAKNEITKELEILEKRLEELKKDEQKEKLIKYKKAVPMFAKALEEYNTLTITEKNEMLKSLIEVIYYTKEIRGSKGDNKKDQFKLDIHYLI